MWRVRSSSLSRRVRSCFLIRSRSYSSSEKHAAMPVCSCVAHPQAIDVERRLAIDDQRRLVAERREVLFRLRVDDVRVGIGGRRQVDLRSRDVEETERVAGGELTRLVGADDVVGHGRNGGGMLRRRPQGAERSDDGHPNIVVKAVSCQLAAIGRQRPADSSLPRVRFDGVGVRVGSRSQQRGRQLCEPLIAQLAKAANCVGRDRLARRLSRVRRQRIHEGAVALQAVIEVRAGRGARRADPSDDLSLFDVRAGADALAEGRQVQVVGLDTARMLQVHEVAARAAVPGRHHHAARYRDDRRAGRRRVVDAEMRA